MPLVVPAPPKMTTPWPEFEFGPASAALRQPPMEIELKYFVPLERVIASGLIDRLEPRRIVQDYFPRSSVPELIDELRLSERFDRTDELTSARLRRSETSRGTLFSIDFKSRKQEGELGRLSRFEVSIPLSFEQYTCFSTRATTGTIEKLRYSLSGVVMPDTKHEMEVTAEVDIIMRAGGKGKLVDPSFALVDIELPDESLVKAMRAGFHTFDLLESKVVELTAASQDLQDVLSSRRMAKHGVGKAERQKIAELHAMCSAPRSPE